MDPRRNVVFRLLRSRAFLLATVTVVGLGLRLVYVGGTLRANSTE